MWNVQITGSTEVWVYQGQQPIARFKHASPKASANHFVKFLKANFTPEEYFAERAKNIAPTTILQQKGYVSYNVLKANKQKS